MNTRTLLLALGLVTAVSCGRDAASPSSPIAPTPAPVLTVSQTTVSLSRTATALLSATSSLGGSSTDVTSAATWRSSNAQVATVATGLITAIGPGTATVSVEHGGQTQAVGVTVRRRVYLRGSALITNLVARSSIESVSVYIDAGLAGGIGTSSPAIRVTARFGEGSGKLALEPGEHVLAFHMRSLAGDYSLEFPGPASMLDFDTGEEVGSVSLANRQGYFETDARVTWNVTIGAYTS